MRIHPAAMLALVVLTPTPTPVAVAAGQQRGAGGDELDELGLWARVVDPRHATAEGRRIPGLALTLDSVGLERHLSSAPAQAWPGAVEESFVLSLPRPEGEVEHFWLVRTTVMEPGLAAKFPEIQAFVGRGIEDSQATLRAVIGPLGFHGTVQSPSGDWDVGKGLDDRGGPYRSRYLERMESSVCESEADGSAHAATSLFEGSGKVMTTSTAVVMRTFRFAVPCNFLFVQQAGGVAATMQVIADMVNGINGTLEVEVAVRLELPVGQDSLLETDPGHDPFQDAYDDLDKLCIKSQQLMKTNQQLGGRYDDGMGLIVNPLGLNKAKHEIGSFCHPEKKGYGAASLPSLPASLQGKGPIHETMHGLGARHTFNSNVGPCAGARDAITAFEPDEGLTLMSYGLRCTHYYSYDLHRLHFSSVVLAQDYLSGVDCGGFETMPNMSPLADAGPNRTLPKYTPFELAATGSDPDGQSLTYCWEQADTGPPSGVGDPDDGQGPINRTGYLSASPVRTVPTLPNVLAGTFDEDDKLPVLGRTYQWAVTARDGQGGVSTDFVTHTVDSSAGPFYITSQTGATTWVGGSAETVTWEVAGTDQGGVGCQQVAILFSADGGATFPYTLANSTPNTGAAEITVPLSSTTRGRIKVKAVDNIFFDINDADVTIQTAPLEMSVLASGQISGSFAGFFPTDPTQHWFVAPWQEVATGVNNLSVGGEGVPEITTWTSQDPSSEGQLYASLGDVRSSGSARAARGSVGASAHAESVNGLIEPQFCFSSSCYDVGTNSWASAWAHSGDEVQAFWTSGDDSGFVRVFLKAVFHGVLDGTSGAHFSATTRAFDRATGATLAQFGQEATQNGEVRIDHVESFWVPSGSVIGVEQDLGVGCFPDIELPEVPRSASVEASNTSTLELWTLPGGTLISGSGADYSPGPCGDIPALVAAPASRQVCEGLAALLTMDATAASAPLYGWGLRHQDGSLVRFRPIDFYFDAESGIHLSIFGADTPQATVVLGARGTSSSFRTVTLIGEAINECGVAATPPVTLTLVTANEVIRGQPSDTQACEGASVSLGVDVAAGLDVTYRWQREEFYTYSEYWSDLVDGPVVGSTTIVSGSDAPTVHLDGVDAAAQVRYRCIVTCLCSTIASSAAFLTVLPGEGGSIEVQPSDASTCVSDDAFFGLQTSAGSTFIYRWQREDPTSGGNWQDLFDGQLPGSTGVILGAGSDALQILQADDSAAGRYRCRLAGACTTLMSEPARLTVHRPPEVVQPPENVLSSRGQDAVFSVGAVSDSPLLFRWQHELAPLSESWSDLVDGQLPGSAAMVTGATTGALTIASPDALAERRYRCVVSNVCGDTASQAATLRLAPPKTGRAPRIP